MIKRGSRDSNLKLIKQWSPEAFQELVSLTYRQEYIDRKESGVISNNEASSIDSFPKLQKPIRSILSRKQQELCYLLQSGLSLKDIAKNLSIRVTLVKEMIHRIKATLQPLYDQCDDKEQFSWLFRW